MNKMTYSKPQFMPILLSETGGNCAFTISYTENTCPVDIPGFIGPVFNENPNPCLYTPTDYEGTTGKVICFGTSGANSNVMGS